MLITIASPVGISNVSDVKPKLKATSKRIFLIHINPIIMILLYKFKFLNKRVSLVAMILFRNFGLSRK